METNFDRRLVVTSRGGSGGGGAALTDAARDLIKRFEHQQTGIKDEVDDTFKRAFDGFV
jgi:molybdate transport repressor ModE-like protein